MKNDIVALFAAIEDGPGKRLQGAWETGSVGIIPVSTCSQTPDSNAEWRSSGVDLPYEPWEEPGCLTMQDTASPADIVMWRLPHLGHYVNTPERSVLCLSLHRLREPALPEDSESLCSDWQFLAIAIINDSLPLHDCSVAS